MAGWTSPDRENIFWDGTIGAKNYLINGDNLIDVFVPYTGATKTVDLNSNNLIGVGDILPDGLGKDLGDGAGNRWSAIFSTSIDTTGTIDLGTNTIADGVMTGNWDFGSGTITTTGTIFPGLIDLGTNTIDDGAFVGDWTWAGDLSLTGTGTNEAIIINQGGDDKGFRINGFDDRSNRFWAIAINQFGAPVVTSSINTFFTGISVVTGSKFGIGSNTEYWFEYDGTDDEWQLWTTNGDGGGTDTKVAWISDGTSIFKTLELQTTQGRIKNTTRVTTTYTILITDDQIFANTDAGAYTSTLPTGVEGQTFRVINSGTTNNLTLAPASGQDLYGTTDGTHVLTPGESAEITFNSTDGWY